MATLKMVLTADESKAVQALRRMDDAQRKVTDRFRQMGKGAKRATRETSSGLRDGARSALGFAAALTGIGTAAAGVMVIINQLKREYENLKQRQAAAAQTQTTVAEARQTALYNLPTGPGGKALPGLGRADVGRMVQRISQKTGITQGTLWQGLRGPVSALGGLPTSVVEPTVTQAARARARAGQYIDISQFAGGVFDIMRATDVRDPAQALGFMRAAGAQMRVTEFQEQMQTVIPVITAARQFGFTAEQGAELGAFATQVSGDPTGRRSATATTRFMQAIRTQRWATGHRGRRITKRRLKAPGMGGLAELQDIYANAPEAVRREIEAQIPGRASVRTAFLGLIRRDPRMLQVLQAVRERLPAPSAPELPGVWEQWAGAPGGRMEALRATGRAADVGVERLQLGSRGAMGGLIRERLPQLLRAAGVSDLHQKLAMAQFEMETGFGGRGVLPAAIRAIRGVQEARQYGEPELQVPGLPLLNWPPWKASVLTENLRGRFGMAEGLDANQRVPNPDYAPELNTKLDAVVTELRAINQQREDAERQGSRE